MDVALYCNCIMHTTNISVSAESTVLVEIDVNSLLRTDPGLTSMQENRRCISKCDKQPICAFELRSRVGVVEIYGAVCARESRT